MKKTAAVYYSKIVAQLDHIAPLSYILGISLLMQDEQFYKIAKEFYPQVKADLKPILYFYELTKNFDILISCSNWFVKDKIAFEILNKKKVKLILCPHGNSDKGYIEKGNMLCYLIPDAVFLYGNHMIDLLKNLKIFKKLKQYVVIGNYRLSFYKKFKKFYDKIVDDKIFKKLNPKNKTILYAPTWKDHENSTSFFCIFNQLIKNMPEHYNLIIKPHPNLEKKHPVEFYQIYEENLPSNVIFLENFPLIYPLLNRCDIYLGDFSSVGYDFLYFQKPMFFIDHLKRDFKTNPSLYLHKCGLQIEKKYWNNIFSFIDGNLNRNFKNVQKKVYEHAYGKELEILEIKKNILKNL